MTSANRTLTAIFHRRDPAFWIVLIALALRLAFVLMLEPNPDFSGGDANWYMRNGRQLVEDGKTPGPLQTPPLYLVLVGTIQVLTPGESFPGYDYTDAEMQAVRVTQAVLGTGVCLLVYLLARRLFSERAGWLVGGSMAISPTLVIEAGNLATEGLFLFWMLAGLVVYTCLRPSPRHMLWAGALLGLATLTRAVFLLFPLGLALHLFLTQRDRWRRLALALLLSYGAVVATWTVYNLAVWERLVIGGEGLLGTLYIGAEGRAAPEDVDAQLGVSPEASHDDRQDALRDAVTDSITGDPVGWITHRVRDLGAALLQPHNTVHFGGESLKESATDWLRDDRSLGGLVDLTRRESFWPKLVLYVFHFSGLLLGTGGMVMAWRRWRSLLPLYGMIAYFVGVHLGILALPRYLLPTYPAFWVFGAALLMWLWERWRAPAVDRATPPAAYHPKTGA